MRKKRDSATGPSKRGGFIISAILYYLLILWFSAGIPRYFSSYRRFDPILGALFCPFILSFRLSKTSFEGMDVNWRSSRRRQEARCKNTREKVVASATMKRIALPTWIADSGGVPMRIELSRRWRNHRPAGPSLSVKWSSQFGIDNTRQNKTARHESQFAFRPNENGEKRVRNVPIGAGMYSSLSVSESLLLSQVSSSSLYATSASIFCWCERPGGPASTKSFGSAHFVTNLCAKELGTTAHHAVKPKWRTLRTTKTFCTEVSVLMQRFSLLLAATYTLGVILQSRDRYPSEFRRNQRSNEKRVVSAWTGKTVSLPTLLLSMQLPHCNKLPIKNQIHQALINMLRDRTVHVDLPMIISRRAGYYGR